MSNTILRIVNTKRIFTVQIGTITQNVNYQNSQYEHWNHLF